MLVGRGSGWYKWTEMGVLTVVDGVEEVSTLFLLFDVCVDEEGVCLGVNILHHDLKTIEAAGLGDLHFAAEALDEVLVDNAIRSSEECEDMGDEVALVVI